jgi:hypothetical protein
VEFCIVETLRLRTRARVYRRKAWITKGTVALRVELRHAWAFSFFLFQGSVVLVKHRMSEAMLWLI